MSNQPFKIPKIAWVILALVLLLQVAVVIIAVRAPSGRSYPKATPQVTVDRVDYDKIGQLIDQRLANLHLINGVDGQPGAVGPVGQTGSVGQAGANGLQGGVGVAVQGPKGDIGNQGEPGEPGKSVEIRYNLTASRIEWRYVGEFSWIPLVTACTLTNTCVGP